MAALGRHVVGLLAIILQLYLLLRLIRVLNLESAAFQNVLRLAAMGFLVHHFLPLRWKMPFFSALSLGGIAVVFGGSVAGLGSGLANAGWIIGIGLALIGICHLPIRYWGRVGLLLATGGLLAWPRTDHDLIPELGPIWTVLGAMFMFRLMVYLYDKEHDPHPQPWARRLAYFFMLPNACFPLFPVVDYKVFGRSHYNADALAIYQKGLRWMVRGVVQLLLYRVVYYHFYIDAGHVAYGSDVIQYCVTASLLYLRVSGQFHLILGLLHLFGFNLPVANRRYFLASSFTDYWRRVNIYWKDFILKVFYYPTFFRLKSWGQMSAMVAATAFCFVVTWFLHAYQSFWVRGKFDFSLQDGMFWGALGLLVIVNTVREANQGRQRTLGVRKPTTTDRLKLGLRTAGTFTVICLLWSIWSADSLSNWARLWTVADLTTVGYGLLVLLVIALAAILEAPYVQWMKRLGVDDDTPQPTFTPRAIVVACLTPLIALLLLTDARVTTRMDEGARLFIASLSTTKPNEYDEDAMERGYYEDLVDVSRANPQLGAILRQRPADWKKLEDTDALVPTGDYRLKELAPSKTTTLNGFTMTTNRWGMRDRDYLMKKLPGTFRIAVMDASSTMGWGVGDGQTYENVLEDRLNAKPPLTGFARYEILNFGINGYSAVCDLVTLEKKVLAFKPDAVIFQANVTDDYWAAQRLVRSLRAGVEPPYDFVQRIVADAGINGLMPEQAALRRLQPHRWDLIESAYARFVTVSRENGAVPVWFLLPRILHQSEHRLQAVDNLNRYARDAGFVILDVSDVFKAHDAAKLTLAPWDTHPNVKGHELLADALYRALQTDAGKAVWRGGGVTPIEAPPQGD
jgi:hypothetical protein